MDHHRPPDPDYRQDCCCSPPPSSILLFVLILLYQPLPRLPLLLSPVPLVSSSSPSSSIHPLYLFTSLALVSFLRCPPPQPPRTTTTYNDPPPSPCASTLSSTGIRLPSPCTSTRTSLPRTDTLRYYHTASTPNHSSTPPSTPCRTRWTSSRSAAAPPRSTRPPSTPTRSTSCRALRRPLAGNALPWRASTAGTGMSTVLSCNRPSH